jgi:hypothetical protein
MLSRNTRPHRAGLRPPSGPSDTVVFVTAAPRAWCSRWWWRRSSSAFHRVAGSFVEGAEGRLADLPGDRLHHVTSGGELRPNDRIDARRRWPLRRIGRQNAGRQWLRQQSWAWHDEIRAQEPVVGIAAVIARCCPGDSVDRFVTTYVHPERGQRFWPIPGTTPSPTRGQRGTRRPRARECRLGDLNGAGLQFLSCWLASLGKA